jgi:tankyrase
MKWVCAFADEFKGHCLLEAARQADPAKVKKYLVPDVVNFKHPYTGDTPLVSIELKQ